MNNDRRKTINRAIGMMQEAMALIESALDEEQGTYDNMPENLQNSERGGASQSAIDNLESCLNDVESAIGYAEEAANS
jgi:hypothetical protein